MKKSLFLYLFILSLLMNIFTYKYFSSRSTAERQKLQVENKKYKDSTLILYNNYLDELAFSLKDNHRAQNYFEKYDYREVEEKVKQALLSFNDSREGNKYIDQAKIGEQKFIINKIRILNHRWLIADYSNGSVWGDVLIRYFINDDNTISFETIESYLYPATLN